MVLGALTPGGPVRRSVRRDHVVCLECGFRGLTLRRHLRTWHGPDALMQWLFSLNNGMGRLKNHVESA
jgi:predicted transcriptional regulator